MRGRFRRKRVGIVLGGMSAEREISQMTGESVARALSERGYNVSVLRAGPRSRDARSPRRRIDVVFNALHGRFGEDGCVQGLLEMMRIPYTGSGVLASAIGMDKGVAKRLWAQAGLPTPEWAILASGRRRGRLVRAAVEAAGRREAGVRGLERRRLDRARAAEARCGGDEGARVRRRRARRALRRGQGGHGRRSSAIARSPRWRSSPRASSTARR